MNLQQALQTFLEESRDLLTDMESILLELELEHRKDDLELYHALFRCVHTIKGSAGMFGLTHVVEFTHVVENFLDRLRLREIRLTPELTFTLLSCRDHIGTLIDFPELQPDDPLVAEGQVLLQALCGDGAAVQTATAESQFGAASKVDVENKSSVESNAAGDSEEVWHISLRFDPDVLQHGMDPLSFIHYLTRLGHLKAIATVMEDLPALAQLDPEKCYLGFEIELVTGASQQEIEQVFEFVETLCQLRILPPRSDVQAYVQLIQSLPEEPQRLGEILVASGAISADELATCLDWQDSTTAPPPRKPIGEVLVTQGLVAPELINAALDKQQYNRERKSGQHLRVQAEKLDQLINLVGEMVIASAAVSLNAARGCDSATRESAAAMALLVEEIRDRSLQLRMVPIGDTFQKMQRIVRDAARELGKEIELVIIGADTELDKTVVEKIADPLVHLVRNACDHGLESPEARRASGKPGKGRLQLNAFHESGAIIIEISDDGLGLDRDRLFQKAVDQGLVQTDAVLSDQEIFNLIFEPGLSTAKQVTNLSGRGVGMDVVRRNIESLRGTVEVHSEASRGTSFRIRLPLTLAIIDGFLSSVGECTYVVPLEMVKECVELPAAYSVDDSRQLLNLRGEVLPLVMLRQHFGVRTPLPRRQNVLIVAYGGLKAGLVVDELLGEHQTVIKPLNELFAKVQGLSGSTILGNGRVALILDVPGLLQLAQSQELAQVQGSHERITHTSAVFH